MTSGIKEDIIKLAKRNFGPHSAKQFEVIAEKIDPEKYPSRFLTECYNYLTRTIGPILSRNFFAPIIEKYGVEIE